MATFMPGVRRFRLLIIIRVSDYQYDVFISYSSVGSARKWLMNNFYEKLVDCLADQIAPAPKVFVDKRMSRGVAWPEEIQKALQRSRIMVAILTPHYFESSWCLAELRSMHAREKRLGLATLERPQGLIYPILYSDSENFPTEEGLLRSWCDFKALATPEPVFQKSRKWEKFHYKVSELAEDLVQLLRQAPDWQADWPLIERPDPILMPSPRIPRFGI